MTLKWFSMDGGSSSKWSFLLGQAPNSSRVLMKYPYSRPTQARIGSHTSYGVTWAWIDTPLEANSFNTCLSVTQVSLPPGWPPSSQYMSVMRLMKWDSRGSARAPDSSYTIWFRTTQPLLKPTSVRANPEGTLSAPPCGWRGFGRLARSMPWLSRDLRSETFTLF